MPASRIFVTPDWLDAERKKSDLVIVDGSWYLATMKRDGKAEYLASHIPGAVHFDLDEISDHSSTLPHMLPSAEVFALHMARLGISDGQRIVVYDGTGLYSAARVRWTLKAFGVSDVSILEGGFPNWCAEGFPVEAGAVVREPGHFTPKFDRSMVADLETVENALNGESAQVIDARSAARFRGEAPEPRAGVRSGHIPGSINLPYDKLVQNGKLVSSAEIKQAFDDAGFDPSKPAITSCGSGVSAVILTLALETIGAKPGAVYDGSWAEWGTNPDKPVATGPAKKS